MYMRGSMALSNTGLAPLGDAWEDQRFPTRRVGRRWGLVTREDYESVQVYRMVAAIGLRTTTHAQSKD